MDRSSTQAEWVAGAAPLFPNLPPVVVSSRWPDGQAREEGLHVIVDGKRPRSCRFLIRNPWRGSLWRALSVRGACRVSSLVSRTHQAKQRRARGGAPGDKLVGKETG